MRDWHWLDLLNFDRENATNRRLFTCLPSTTRTKTHTSVRMQPMSNNSYSFCWNAIIFPANGATISSIFIQILVPAYSFGRMHMFLVRYRSYLWNDLRTNYLSLDPVTDCSFLWQIIDIICRLPTFSVYWVLTARLEFLTLFYLLLNWSICFSAHNITNSFIITADFLHICRKSDPQLNDCIKTSIDILRPFLIKGIPSLDIPSIDPIEIGDLLVSENTRSNSNGIQITAKDIKSYGSSNFIIKSLE